MSRSEVQNSKPAGLLRELGVSQASAIVVGTIIGSGIFLVPAEMMQAVGSARLVYLAWIVGGLLSLAGAITYAELGAMKPQAGGEYIYIRDAYGPLPAFLYAWTWFIVAKPGSIATIATGIVRILGTFPALAFFTQPVIRMPFVVTLRSTCGDFGGRAYHLAELHGSEEGRRVSIGLHHPESGDDRRCRCRWIYCSQRHVEKLQYALCRRNWRHRRVHGGAGCGVVGV